MSGQKKNKVVRFSSRGGRDVVPCKVMGLWRVPRPDQPLTPCPLAPLPFEKETATARCCCASSNIF